MELQGVNVLTLLYISFGDVSDKSIDPKEWQAITTSIYRWTPNEDRKVIDGIMQDVKDFYFQLTNYDDLISTLHNSIDKVKLVIPEKEKLKVVFEDLITIAKAKGVLRTDAVEILDMCARSWELKSYFSDDDEDEV
ncbi:MAG: hypothetical protein K8S56_05040 [Candidatus Cloacimonetes bacterium]|nr:hypothetical protein [Candidatus Cloacimonadota bacterium]